MSETPYTTHKVKPVAIRLQRNYVLIEDLKMVDEQGQIVLPDSEKDKIKHGVIRGVGPDAYAVGWKRGMHVLYRRQVATEFWLYGEKLKVLFESEIIGVKLDKPMEPEDEATCSIPVAKTDPAGRTGQLGQG